MTPKRAPTRRTNAERTATTRNRLIGTTIELIGERGYRDISIKTLAKAAGMTTGAVQHHFQSKAVLMMEVLNALLDSAIDTGKLWPLAELPLQVRAEKFLIALWDLIYAKPRFIVSWNIYLDCRNQQEIIQHIADLRMKSGRKLEQGFFDVFPEIKDSPDRYALMGVILSTLRGLGFLQLFAEESQRHVSENVERQLVYLADQIVSCAKLSGAGHAQTT